MQFNKTCLFRSIHLFRWSRRYFCRLRAFHFVLDVFFLAITVIPIHFFYP